MCVTSLHRHDEGVSRRGFLKAGAAAALGAAATVAGPAAPVGDPRRWWADQGLDPRLCRGLPDVHRTQPSGGDLDHIRGRRLLLAALDLRRAFRHPRRRARPLRRGQPPRPRVDPGRVDGASGGDRHLRPRRGRSRRRGHRGRHPQLRAPPRTDPRGALVCEYSGWEVRVDDQDAYRNPGSDGLFHFPGFSGEAVEFLLGRRDRRGGGGR